MRASNAAPIQLGLGVLLLLGIFAWAPATFPGYWESINGFVPVFNAGSTTAVASIATTPDLWRGAGSATTLFTRPFINFGLSPTVAVRMAFVLAFIIGGCAVYAWLRRDLGDRAAGFAGLIYMLQPIFLATVYVHGSLADALILAWLPVALAGLARYARDRSLAGAVVAAIALIAMWRTQAGLAVFATLLLLAYTLFAERSLASTIVVLLAAATGFVTLLPDWSLATFAPTPAVAGFAWFVQPFQYFGVRWPGVDSPAATGSFQEQYPFQLGFAVLAFSIITLWTWFSRSTPQRRPLGFAFVTIAVLVVLTFPFAAPLWQVTHADRLLTYPWQLLVLAAPLLALTAGALPLVQPALATPAYWSALVALVVLGSYPYLAPKYTEVQAPAKPAAVFGANQLVLLNETLTETPGSGAGTPRTAALDVTWQVLAPLAADDNVFFQALAGSDEQKQVVAQLDAPPLGSDNPPTAWQPGQIYTARYQLDLSKAPPGQPLQYYFGFYDWKTGERMRVDGGIDDKVVLYGR